ncbi:MAG: tRNA uridine-5-carboxymethylaminomethyl(34) synthesis enzyme MnmG [Sedimentisphaeraceae bacterium JB056]
MINKQYDCIVIGGGHAGIEAAHAAARLGASTMLLTIRIDTIGAMSCNPSIGGLGKGQLTREIDALGGLMAKAIDATGLQFKLLNRSKGPAVQSPRAQADKYAYKQYMQDYLVKVEGLDIVQGIAADIMVKDSKVTAVTTTDGRKFETKTAIVTAGTFLRGIMHIGEEQIPGGRLGEPPSNELSQSLKKLGLKVERLKTGTPVRLDASTLDYDKMQKQDGEEEPVPFSFVTDKIERPQIPCWITSTNEKVHKILHDNLERAPLYSGQILSTGPRYCPSIETKILRFPEKHSHQIFVEPESADQTTMYPNGISTSVPKDVQEAMLKNIPGLENAKIVHYAYAIEYDYCPPDQLRMNLETRSISGLFMAGQVNGTSGYEEAGAQGIYAGINAVRLINNQEPMILGRDQAYIGVMIDDLLTKEIIEPYRMFTSRAEYRLALRADNADRRLTPIGREIGLVDDERWKIFSEKIHNINILTDYMKNTRLNGVSYWQKLAQPQSNFKDEFAQLDFIKELAAKPEVIEAVQIDAKYEGYLEKEQKLVRSFRNLENQKVPDDIDYDNVPHLRAEARERLSSVRPFTLGQASRIGGITPADITVIQVFIKRSKGWD